MEMDCDAAEGEAVVGHPNPLVVGGQDDNEDDEESDHLAYFLGDHLENSVVDVAVVDQMDQRVVVEGVAVPGGIHEDVLSALDHEEGGRRNSGVGVLAY